MQESSEKMWCDKCKHETNSEFCELCGNKTESVIPTEVYWCNQCKTPIIIAVNEKRNCECPLCGGQINYLSSDLRPVFPEERLLIEILLDEPMKYCETSVWANNNRYYFDGKPFAITSKHYKNSRLNTSENNCKNSAKKTIMITLRG